MREKMDFFFFQDSFRGLKEDSHRVRGGRRWILTNNARRIDFSSRKIHHPRFFRTSEHDPPRVPRPSVEEAVSLESITRRNIDTRVIAGLKDNQG